MRLSPLVALSLLGVAGAFAPGRAPPTKLSVPAVAKDLPSVRGNGVALNADVPSSQRSTESQREKWRTVHTFDDWVQFRSPNRFFTILGTVGKSGILNNLQKEVSIITAIAVAVLSFNTFFVEGYTDLTGVHQDALVNFGLPLLGLPLTPFTVSSPSLGLLLVFRTNASYKRWDEARKAWGLNINHTRNLVRMATAWSSAEYEPDEEKRKAALKRLARSVWSFVRSLKRHLSDPADEADFQAELYEKLPQEQADAIIAAVHRPNRAMFEISCAVNDLPMHFMRRNEIDKDVIIFEDTCGGSERLFSSPVPIFYTRHTARFLSAWLLLLPFALYQPFENTWNHIGMVPAAFVISIFLFGIEELAVQLEEPFSILPMQGFCNKIGANLDEIIEWHEEPAPETPPKEITPTATTMAPPEQVSMYGPPL